MRKYPVDTLITQEDYFFAVDYTNELNTRTVIYRAARKLGKRVSINKTREGLHVKLAPPTHTGKRGRPFKYENNKEPAVH